MIGHVLGSTSHPDEAFVVQTMRALTDDIDGVLGSYCMLICDRDRKWSAVVERFLATAEFSDITGRSDDSV